MNLLSFGSVIDIWLGMSTLLFALWPLMLIGLPVGGKRRKRSVSPLTGFLLVWLVLALMRASLLLYSRTPPSFFIPEPLNTVLFFLAGAGVLAFVIIRRVRSRPNLWNAAEEARSPQDLMALSPRAFEELVVELYTALGHNARRTRATGDHGVDVVVKAKNGEKWVVQCKRWRGNVGEPIIRDFYGVMHHEKADKGMIITAGDFTQQARVWAKGKPITLVSGEQFLKYLKKARQTNG